MNTNKTDEFLKDFLLNRFGPTDSGEPLTRPLSQGLIKIIMQAYADQLVKEKVEEIRQWLIDEDYEGLAETL